jgi:hypothetical protein
MFFFLLTPKVAKIKLTEFKVNCNYNIVKVTFQLINDELLGIKLNLTYDIFEALEKMRVTLKVRIPKSEKDRDYTQDFFQTSIDVERMFKNVHGNIMIKMITEPYFQALDVKVGKFPIPKVRNGSKLEADNFLP